MKKEYAEKWVDALRSGKYTQTKGKLYDGESYCCLGVLCDILGYKFRRISLIGKFVIDDASGKEGSDSEWHGCLPPMAIKEVGMKSETGVVLHNCTLATLNDDGKDFNFIADVIEKYKDEL